MKLRILCFFAPLFVFAINAWACDSIAGYEPQACATGKSIPEAEAGGGCCKPERAEPKRCGTHSCRCAENLCGESTNCRCGETAPPKAGDPVVPVRISNPERAFVQPVALSVLRPEAEHLELSADGNASNHALPPIFLLNRNFRI